MGRALGRSLRRLGWRIGAVVTRSAAHSRAAVRAIGAGKPVATLSSEVMDADVILLLTPDDVLAEVARQLAKLAGQQCRGKIVLHGSGALDNSVLRALARCGAATGSIHPMQTFTNNSQPNLKGVIFAIEGHPRARRAAAAIARSLGGIPVPVAGRGKPAYHAAGTLVAGHALALTEAAAQLLIKLGFTSCSSRTNVAAFDAPDARQLRKARPARCVDRPGVARRLRHGRKASPGVAPLSARIRRFLRDARAPFRPRAGQESRRNLAKARSRSEKFQEELAVKNLHIPVEHTTLANGLRVVISPDRSAPVVTVGVYYQIGFRLEPRGRSGFAHLFEHMMFQGSEHAGKMEHIRLINSSGGMLNGTTNYDITNYFESVPSNALERVLWLEADRMRALKVDDENLRNQRDVVKEEVRVNVMNQPYGGFPWLDLPPVAFRNWPNAHNFYGDFADLDAATLADVQTFFHTYYSPNNAVLLMVGDLDPAEGFALAKRHFENIPTHPLPPRADVTEPPQTEERRGEVVEKFGPLPAIAIGYTVPDRRNPDWYAASILDHALHGGRVGPHLSPPRPRKANRRGNRWRRGHHRNQRPHANGDAHFSQAGIHHRRNHRGVRRNHSRNSGAGNQRRRAGARESETARRLLFQSRRRHGSTHATLRSDALPRVLHSVRRRSRTNQHDSRWIPGVTPAQVQAAAQKYLVPRIAPFWYAVPSQRKWRHERNNHQTDDHRRASC